MYIEAVKRVCPHCRDQHICPEPVRTAPADRVSRTTLDEYVEERLEPVYGAEGWTPSSHIYADYCAWARRRGEDPAGPKHLAQALRRADIPAKKASIMYWSARIRD